MRTALAFMLAAFAATSVASRVAAQTPPDAGVPPGSWGPPQPQQGSWGTPQQQQGNWGAPQQPPQQGSWGTPQQQPPQQGFGPQPQGDSWSQRIQAAQQLNGQQSLEQIMEGRRAETERATTRVAARAGWHGFIGIGGTFGLTSGGNPIDAGYTDQGSVVARAELRGGVRLGLGGAWEFVLDAGVGVANTPNINAWYPPPAAGCSGGTYGEGFGYAHTQAGIGLRVAPGVRVHFSETSHSYFGMFLAAIFDFMPISGDYSYGPCIGYSHDSETLFRFALLPSIRFGVAFGDREEWDLSFGGGIGPNISAGSVGAMGELANIELTRSFD